MRRKQTMFSISIVMMILLSTLAWGQLVINEVYYDSPGTDTGCFTEIKGPPGTNLDGYALVGINGVGGAEYATISLSGHTIPDDGYFVIAQDNTVQNYDMIDPLADWQNANSGGGGQGDNVVLRLNGSTVDALGYGVFTGSGVFAGEGEPAPDVLGSSLGRYPDGIDTNNNYADFQEFANPTPGVTNGGGPGEPTVYDCGELQLDDQDGVPIHLGEYVQVTAVAIVADLVFDTLYTNFYIQDVFGGVNIFSSNVQMTVAEGDCVTVLGTVTQYNGLTEISTPYLDYTNHGAGTMPDPVLLTTQVIATSGEDYESTLARLEGCNIVGGDPWPSPGNNANILIDDGSGSCTLHIDKDTNLDEWTGPTGAFNLVGIVNQYDYTSPYTEGYQILPRRVEDFTTSSEVSGNQPEVVREFKLLPVYPNPFNPNTTVSFWLTSPTEHLKLSVFDITGRLVAILRNGSAEPGQHIVNWNAGNLASGTYFIRLEADNHIVTKSAVLIK
jgi:hypothetical protein